MSDLFFIQKLIDEKALIFILLNMPPQFKTV